MRAKLLIPLFVYLFVTTGCDKKSPLAPTVPLNQQFTLAPGQSASLQDTSLTVKFVGVSGDSRCPADALCILGGDATVHVRATTNTSADYDLHTGDPARAAAVHDGVRIVLDQLQPYPFSSRTIDPGEYRATLTVSR
jgi:hypothetical protein